MKVEVWDTRFGTSVRVVVRDRKGHFVNNKSEKQVVKVVFDLVDRGEYIGPDGEPLKR